MPLWLLSLLPKLWSVASHWSFKAISIVLAVALVAGGAWMAYRGIVNREYNRGYKTALQEHPQNIYYGPTTVLQGKRMSCFPLKIGRFGLGVCHD